jgi:nitronate monooxygenase
MALPVLIQGGMGVAISDWRLTRAVSQAGHLGVVAGTALNCVLACRLADGDPGGHLRRTLGSFPLPEVAQAILDRYYVAGGKKPDQPYRSPPAYTIHPPATLDQFTVLATFAEVWLAREGHGGLVGINLLEKVQMPILGALYGAMLAGVDYVLVGAGIPMQIATLLDKLARHEAVSYRLDVQDAGPDDDYRIHLDPEALFPGLARRLGPLKRPRFLPIISSVVLAQALLKRSEGTIDGFVIEGPTAGGHNAPPRGPLTVNSRGEPLYGEKDVVDLRKMAQLGRPFWLAGGYGNPTRVQEARAAGAAGVQVGTAFALCEESGLEAQLKERLLRQVQAGEAQVLTSMAASPTGFPFKVALVPGTVSDLEVYDARQRVCDLGFLRTLYKKPDGSLGYRCPAEPVDDYVKKSGRAADTAGRMCLCNHLLASAGFPQQRRGGYVEPPLVTTGDDLPQVAQFLKPGQRSYSAADVIDHLLGRVAAG